MTALDVLKEGEEARLNTLRKAEKVALFLWVSQNLAFLTAIGLGIAGYGWRVFLPVGGGLLPGVTVAFRIRTAISVKWSEVRKRRQALEFPGAKEEFRWSGDTPPGHLPFGDRTDRT